MSIATHGTNRISGKRIANPTAPLLAARHLRKAIDQVLNQDQIRTRNLSGTASTSDFAKALVQRVSSRA